MTADFWLKIIFAIGVGSMVVVFLRDSSKAANASDSTTPAVPGEVDGAHQFMTKEELFYDEEGPYSTSQQSDELIKALVEEEQNLLEESYRAFKRLEEESHRASQQ